MHMHKHPICINTWSLQKKNISNVHKVNQHICRCRWYTIIISGSRITYTNSTWLIIDKLVRYQLMFFLYRSTIRWSHSQTSTHISSILNLSVFGAWWKRCLLVHSSRIFVFTSPWFYITYHILFPFLLQLLFCKYAVDCSKNSIL